MEIKNLTNGAVELTNESGSIVLSPYDTNVVYCNLRALNRKETLIFDIEKYNEYNDWPFKESVHDVIQNEALLSDCVEDIEYNDINTGDDEELYDLLYKYLDTKED